MCSKLISGNILKVYVCLLVSIYMKKKWLVIGIRSVNSFSPWFIDVHRTDKKGYLEDRMLCCILPCFISSYYLYIQYIFIILSLKAHDFLSFRKVESPQEEKYEDPFKQSLHCTVVHSRQAHAGVLELCNGIHCH